MEDLAQIVAVMFVAWIASGVTLVALALLAPIRWPRLLRSALMLVAAAVFVILTGALFGIGWGVPAAIASALVAFLSLRRN